MNNQENNYKILIDKLDSFIRKYYKNLLIKGGIYSFSIVLLFGLIITVLEYFGHFETTVRTVLFYSFITLNIYILTKLIVIPLFKLYKLGKVISYEQAANIIGTHFQNIRDKLLNTLQLHRAIVNDREENTSYNLELVEASINQKIAEIKPIPFTAAINFSDNKKYLKYALVPIILFSCILFSAPGVITESAARLIDHRIYFEKPAPFSFSILNKELKAIQQEDFQLDVKVAGNIIPDNVYIEIDGNQFRLEKENKISFSHLFKNIQKNISFRLFGEGLYSKPYELVALPNPLVLNFDITVEYPAYLHKIKEVIKNTGDLIIPAGTKLNWRFTTKNTEHLKINFKDTSVNLLNIDEGTFSCSKRFFKNDSYSVSASNQYLKNKDSIQYSVSVVPDAFPSISVEEQRDSLSSKRFYFKGLIKDDYGFNKLTFNYHLLHKNDSSNKSIQKDLVTELIPVNKLITQDQFFYFWDLTNTRIEAGDEIEYYFEIWDNDGVTGSKSAKSQTLVFKTPSLQDIAENAAKNNEEIKSDIKASIQEAKKLQKDFNDFSKKLFEKKELGWDDKKKASDLLNRQKELERKIDNIQKENKKNNREQSEYKPVNEELLTKQEQLNELMDKLMTDEMRKLMEELQRMMEKADKSQLQEQMEKMKLSNKEVEKELDRSLAIFKQMEFQQKMQEAIDNIDKLAQKQEELSKESVDKNANNKELEKKQEDLNNQFKEVQKELSDLEKKNESLEFKEEFKNPEEDQKAIQQDMQNSGQQLSESKNKKASQSQKNAAEKMAKMSDKLKQQQEDSEQQQAEEDMNALRAILENLIRLSFNQEQLMMDVKTTDINNPKYLKISQQQRKLKDDSKMIEDSLFALSKRVVQIQSVINREISSINQNMEISLNNLEDRQTEQARSRQQYVMTSVNNLALLLSEIMESMQQQMAAKSKPSNPGGKSSCKKPGDGAPSLSNMRKLQQQLNQQMKEVKDGMTKNGKSGGKGMSEALAKLAAQQEMIRNEINKMNQQQNKDGKESLGNLQKITEEMEQTETDLVNKILNQETLKRQQEILTRLLESEKADKEREQDNKRESTEAKSLISRNSSRFDEYKKQKQKEMELLKTIPPSLSPFYKRIVNEYFQKIEN